MDSGRVPLASCLNKPLKGLTYGLKDHLEHGVALQAVLRRHQRLRELLPQRRHLLDRRRPHGNHLAAQLAVAIGAVVALAQEQLHQRQAGAIQGALGLLRRRAPRVNGHLQSLRLMLGVRHVGSAALHTIHRAQMMQATHGRQA